MEVNECPSTIMQSCYFLNVDESLPYVRELSNLVQMNISEEKSVGKLSATEMLSEETASRSIARGHRLMCNAICI